MKKTFFALAAGAAALSASYAYAEPAPAAAAPAASVEGETDIVADAVAFAKDLTAKATAALTSDKAKADQLAEFQEVLNQGLALDVIGRFMLGDVRKSMNEEQIKRYDGAFPPYLTKLYADQFADIVGKPLEVVDSKQITPRDVIVRTRFDRNDGPPINVDWRVRKLSAGGEKAIDIIVSGVSIMLVKREEFASFIKQNGVDALIDRIEAEGSTG
ncbi:MAG: ABC transporter substrate-binding protein [Parvularculaceae bacterium]